jgi:hypothetical protein
MTFARLSLVCFVLAGAASAQDTGGVAELNGEAVILAPDFTWRFDDSGGVRCTNLVGGTAVCALPSSWAPIPGDPVFGRRLFQQGKDLRGSVTVLTPPTENDAITVGTVMRIINGDRGKDSNYGLGVEKTTAKLAGKEATTLVSVIGTTETRVYSYVYLADGRVILAMTVEDPSFQFTFSHRTAHATFLSAIQVEGAE